MKQQELSISLSEAASDYLYLLNKSYPPSLISKTIGDRYRLKTFERNMLIRGLFRANDVIRRKKITIQSLLPPSEMHSEKAIDFLYIIDGYNILFTVMNYFKGIPLFKSNDGFLRDCGNSKGQVKNTALLKKTTESVFNFLFSHTAKLHIHSKFIIFLDSPVSSSGNHKNLLSSVLSKYPYTSEVKLVKNADISILNEDNAIVCTADSYIIDSIVDYSKNMLVYDLAYHTLTSSFANEFIDFGFYPIH